MKKRHRRWGVPLVLATLALGASCSSYIKGQSAELKRGRDGDEAKPYTDLAPYVTNREVRPPDDVPADLRVQDPDVKDRQLWQNFKNWPRNYKFSVAIAPLREEFRRGDKEGGEPASNFATRPPGTPIDDSERREAAKLSPADSEFGFQVTQVSNPNAGLPSTTKPAEAPKETPTPPAETPKETPTPPLETPKETPAPEEVPQPRRVGMNDPATPLARQERFAAAGATDPAPASPNGTAKTAESAAEERARHVADVSAKEGMNFPIDSDKFKDRMKQVLEEFRVFERVDPINYGDEAKTLDGLFAQADARKNDFLLLCSLRRNKVSYRGWDLGPAAADNLIEFAILFNEFWSPIHREQYECDVELYVQLFDVRSRHRILDQTFEGHDALSLSSAQRGWHILRNWIAWTGIDINREGLFDDVGEYVRPGAWLDMEIKLLDTFQNTLKAHLDDEAFDTETNRLHNADGSVQALPPRQLGLVVGITEYGPAAQPLLTRWAAGNQSLDDAQHIWTERYENQPVKLGTRAYAEDDARRIAKDFLTHQGALESTAGVPQAFLAALIGKEARLSDLRAGFRQIARARKDDRVFVYLNGETIVLDDPTRPDGESKYFLPYDIDLQKVDDAWKRGGSAAAREYLDKNALSFDWIEACFNRDSLADHIYLESQHALVVVDCSFPGQSTGDRFCPERGKRARNNQLPNQGINAIQEPQEKAPEKQPEKAPEKAPESDDDTPKPRRVGLVSPRVVVPTTVPAGDPAPVASGTAAAVASAAFTSSTGFLERIAQGGQGRFVVLTAAPGEFTLDIPTVKQGGFVYYFTQFLDTSKQKRFLAYRDERGDFTARRIVEYAADRLESESREEGQSQHVLSLGAFADKDKRYVLVKKVQ